MRPALQRCPARALLAGGIDAASIDTRLDEAEAARALLRELRTGDLLVLPLHEVGARDDVVHVLEAMRAGQWRPGEPLPQGAARVQHKSETE